VLLYDCACRLSKPAPNPSGEHQVSAC
jgi:hypothetical protein